MYDCYNPANATTLRQKYHCFLSNETGPFLNESEPIRLSAISFSHREDKIGTLSLGVNFSQNLTCHSHLNLNQQLQLSSVGSRLEM